MSHRELPKKKIMLIDLEYHNNKNIIFAKDFKNQSQEPKKERATPSATFLRLNFRFFKIESIENLLF